MPAGPDNAARRGRKRQHRVARRRGRTTSTAATDTDTNNADGGDIRSNCELPAPLRRRRRPRRRPRRPRRPAAPAGGAEDDGGHGELRLLAEVPEGQDILRLHRQERPEGLQARGALRQLQGKKCKGKLGKSSTIKKTTKRSISLKGFNKRYPAGSQLEVIVSKAGYKTQIKIVQVRKNKIPSILTRCQSPPSAKRGAC